MQTSYVLSEAELPMIHEEILTPVYTIIEVLKRDFTINVESPHMRPDFSSIPYNKVLCLYGNLIFLCFNVPNCKMYKFTQKYKIQ